MASHMGWATNRIAIPRQAQGSTCVRLAGLAQQTSHRKQASKDNEVLQLGLLGHILAFGKSYFMLDPLMLLVCQKVYVLL